MTVRCSVCRKDFEIDDPDVPLYGPCGACLRTGLWSSAALDVLGAPSVPARRSDPETDRLIAAILEHAVRAVERERERCAVIADDHVRWAERMHRESGYGSSDQALWSGEVNAAKTLARKIREIPK